MVHRQSFLGLCFYLCVLLFSSSQVCGYQDSVPTGEKEADKTIFPETYPQKAEVFGDQSLEKMLRDLIVKTVRPSPSTNEQTLDVTKLPPFIRKPAYYPNGSGDETVLERLVTANLEIIGTLSKHDAAELVKELELRLKNEESPDMKLFLTTFAAAYGSRTSALMLLERMKSTKYDTMRSTHAALRAILYQLEDDQPDWIVRLVIASLSDWRPATDHKIGSRPLTISYFGDEDGNLTWALGHTKCKKAVPFLIQMCERTKGSRGPVSALGLIGDDRAVPVLLECLKKAGETHNPISAKVEAGLSSGFGLSDEFIRPVEALSNLKSREAVPELLKYIAFPDVIDALAKIDEPRMVKPLEELVSNKGRILEANGTEILPSKRQERLIRGKITLACLDKDKQVFRLCNLLTDKTFGEFDRREIVWQLGNRPDPKAIPFLIQLIKTDSSGAVVNQSVTVLTAFKNKASVDGLIDCFDAISGIIAQALKTPDISGIMAQALKAPDISGIMAQIQTAIDSPETDLRETQVGEIENFFRSSELQSVQHDLVKWLQTAIQLLQDFRGKLSPEVSALIKHILLPILIAVYVVAPIQTYVWGSNNQNASERQAVRNTNIVVNLIVPKPESNLRIVDGFATIHRKPKGKSEPINVAISGDCLEVLEVRKKWRLVRFYESTDTCEGWVRAKYLKKIKPLSRHWLKNNRAE